MKRDEAKYQLLELITHGDKEYVEALTVAVEALKQPEHCYGCPYMPKRIREGAINNI